MSIVEELSKYASPPEGTNITLEPCSGNGFRVIIPSYGWEGIDKVVGLFNLFWIITFSVGVYITFAWYSHLWYAWVLAIGVIIGLVLWVLLEVNSLNERQVIEVTPQSISVFKERLFRSMSEKIPISRIFKIDLEMYPRIEYYGPRHEDTLLFMEYSTEEEQVWILKLIKVYLYQKAQRKL